MRFLQIAALTVAWFLFSGNASGLEPIRLSPDKSHFILKESGARFVPWGFNYLGEQDALFEEYWEEKWDSVAEDFREMRKLGANVVRVHLQLETYMTSAEQTKPAALARLRKLLDLAQQNSLYLDITGLGCYRIARVPPWLDSLSEVQRWAVHERFWRAIAETIMPAQRVCCAVFENNARLNSARGNDNAPPATLIYDSG